MALQFTGQINRSGAPSGNSYWLSSRANVGDNDWKIQKNIFGSSTEKYGFTTIRSYFKNTLFPDWTTTNPPNSGASVQYITAFNPPSTFQIQGGKVFGVPVIKNSDTIPFMVNRPRFPKYFEQFNNSKLSYDPQGRA